jgi:tricarballylate dehydrogenase
MSIGTAFGRIAGHQAALGALAQKRNEKGVAHANA